MSIWGNPFGGSESEGGGSEVTFEVDSQVLLQDGDADVGVSGKVVSSDHVHPADATIIKQADVVDTLDSESTTAPLSANQGRVLELGKSDTGHDHDSDYAADDHNHDLTYSAIAHDHDEDYAADDHVHGSITNDGKVGVDANIPLITGVDGVVGAGAFGTSANEFAEGDHDHDSDYEAALGNPSVDDRVLSSKADGTRSWVVLSAGGDVSGPAESVSNNFSSFDGTGGKTLKDSGVGADSFATASHDHDSDYAADDHVHGTITNDGKVGVDANIPLITGVDGVVGAGAFGTSANEFAEGDHDHDSDYAAGDHNHDLAYSAIAHDHDEDYAADDHNHDLTYSAIAHDHDEDYAAGDHNHDLTYSAIAHDHDEDYSADDHVHGNITNDGKIGSTANLPVMTGTAGAVTVGSFGGSANQPAEGDKVALLAGRSGGQTLIGGTASGNSLTLQSSSHETKGKILFGTSAYDEVNNLLGVGTASPTKKLDIVGSGINLENTTTNSTGIIWKNGTRFMHNFQHPTGGGAVPTGLNTFLGAAAGNLTMGSGATLTDHASFNTGVGVYSLANNSNGYSNTGVGYGVLHLNTIGMSNAALGTFCLYSNTDGYSNLALGHAAGSLNTTGHTNVFLGHHAGRVIANGSTDNATSNTSLYLGADTKALADGGANEIVVGYNAIGAGSNTVVLGNTSIVTTILRGSVGLGGTTSPTAKLHLPAGTASANTAPLKLTTGTLLTTPEAGAIEYLQSGTEGRLYASYKINDAVTRVELASTRSNIVLVTGNGSLTEAQCLDTIVVNTGMSSAGESTFPALSYRTRVTLLVEAAGKDWELVPPSGEKFVLSGTEFDADQHVIVGDVLGDGCVLMRMYNGAAYQWWIYVSKGTFTKEI